MTKRILLYYTHKEDLGHSIRILNVIQFLKKRYKNQVEIFVFQGGKIQSFLKIPPDVHWFNLPHSFYSRAHFRNTTEIPPPSIIAARIKYMTSKIKKVKPHVFINDFFPFGRLECKYELLPVIKELKHRKTKIYASIAYPYFISNPSTFLPFCNLYDNIFIHTPENIDPKYFYRLIEREGHSSKQSYHYVFNERLREKIIYTGYIAPFNIEKTNRNLIRRKFNAQNKILVVVSRGGGAFYPKIITHSILAKKYLDNKYVLLVLAGPSTSKEEMKLFKKCFREVKYKGVYLKKYTNDFYKILQAADISVSTSGYNTSIELLYLQKKSILIPFIGYNKRSIHIEQLCHAQILRDKINSVILDYNKLSPQLISLTLQKKHKKNNGNNRIEKSWFEGARIFSNIIMGR